MVSLVLAWKGHLSPCFAFLVLISRVLVKFLSSFTHSSQGRLPGDESWGLRYVVAISDFKMLYIKAFLWDLRF